MTPLESTIVMSVVIVGLLVGAAVLIRTTVSDSGQGGIPVALPAVVNVPADAPVSVSVPAAGTIADSSSQPDGPKTDACADLRGVQPSGFDCSLPLYVPALDLSAVRVKAPYQCPDPVNYRLVKGQAVQRDKQCVLKTAKAGRS